MGAVVATIGYRLSCDGTDVTIMLKICGCMAVTKIYSTIVFLCAAGFAVLLGFVT